MRWSPSLVKNALSGHSWLGLLAGAAMYAICLSGALLVFHAELERWEQPQPAEYAALDHDTLQGTLNDFVAAGAGLTPHLYLVLPTKDSPRARLASETHSWFVNADGSLGEAEDNAWSEMLLDLHLYLHLPEAWGMLVVSATGVLLIALIVSGLLAHPRLFRDAFALRVGGSKQLEQTDLHNRLSVWGAPFYLLIAITGAYFGLAVPNLELLAKANDSGHEDRVIAMLFGEEPDLQQTQSGPVAVASALDQVAQRAPGATPLLLVLHDADTPGPYLTISAQQADRLVYSETYQFAADGRFLGTEGTVDGPLGKRVVYSVYRMHFGNFAGLLTKGVYALLGLGLAIVSVTGINIWLARRRRADALGDLWVGLVWGLPLALVAAAVAKLLLALTPLAIVWCVLVASCLYAVAAGDPRRSRSVLRWSLSVALLLLPFLHVAVHGAAALRGAAAVSNGLLLTAGLLGALILVVSRSEPSAPEKRDLVIAPT